MGAGNAPGGFCTGKLSQSWYFSPRSQAPLPAPPAQRTRGEQSWRWSGTWGLPAQGHPGQGSHCNCLSGLSPSERPCPSGALWDGITITTFPGGETETQTDTEGPSPVSTTSGSCPILTRDKPRTSLQGIKLFFVSSPNTETMPLR